jgi:hypothetical protein
MSRDILLMAILASSLLMSPIAVSEVYYRWVDAQGQVHYSDQQPQAGVEKVEVIDIPGVPAESTLTPPSSPEQDLERIRKLTREWEVERKNLEAERQTLEEQRRQESLANQNEEQPAPAGQQLTPSWWWPIIDNPCFQYPWGCPPPLPPYYPLLSPLPLVRPHPPLLHPPLVRPHPPLLHPPLSHPLLVRPHPSLSRPHPPLSHPPLSHPLPEQPKPH